MKDILNEIIGSAMTANENKIEHIGMPRRSGRYPYGSGKNPFQHAGDFLSRVEEMRKSNYEYVDPETGKRYSGDTAIAKSMQLTTTQFRTQYTLARNEERAYLYARAKSLQEDGLNPTEIAKVMGYANESSVRNLLDAGKAAKMYQSEEVANYLKDIVDTKGMVDVGAGVEREIGNGISKEKMREALYILEMQGYPTYGVGMPQATNKGQQTNIQVLCPPGTEHKDAYDFGKINSVKDYEKIIVQDSEGNDTVRKSFEYPASLDSKRLMIKYAEEGGINKDGVIELRRNCKDLDLGESNYAQVRIMVDGTHYLKGMALYADDLPDGIDVRFNTNKKLGTPQNEVLKKIKEDPDNPFGSLIKERGGQYYYDDPDGKYTDPITGKKQSLGLINKRAEEGDWGEWADKLPAQFLSKQNKDLAVRQLNLAKADKQDEFNDICTLNNPTIKRYLLNDFAEDCDSASVHLHAAALPRQKYQVILPLTSIKDDEIYAPNYRDGEKVALVRFPHEGTYQIPILKVNNKLKEGRDIIGKNALDAVGINAKNAEKLSGADFDGDTVMVIPTGGRIKISNRNPLKGLEDFDSKVEYGCDEHKKGEDGKEHYFRNGKEYKLMSKEQTQIQMGIISNLVTDMTLKGATENEMAAATRHAMVVIDAEKHHLDYQQSYKDNNIASLKRKYQGHIDEETGQYREGAATLISRAKSQVDVVKRKGSPKIAEDGSLIWKEDPNAEYVVYKKTPMKDSNGKDILDKKGNPKMVTMYDENHKPIPELNKDGSVKTKIRKQKSTQMAETKDAYTLVSDYNTQMELVYADYANKMKSLANQARKEMKSTGNLKYDPHAKDIFKEQVESLDAKLSAAQKNAPRERKAQAITNSIMAEKKKMYDMDKKEEGKLSQKILSESRKKVGAKRQPIVIDDKEWEAIQAGAISDNKLSQMLKYCDKDRLRSLATPRQTTTLSAAKISKIQAMKNSNYTNAEIAESMKLPVSTISYYLKGEQNG